jgi:hypothetical protein
MLFDRITRGSLDYCLYRHGRSKAQFRGPKPDLTRTYLCAIGANETYGKFVPRPWPTLLQARLGVPVANFGVMNAGVDFYLRDPSVLLACQGARATVVAVTGAQNVSNRFYTVHPRRNDRFVAPSRMLQTLFREVEFGDIHFTRHLLQVLAAADAVKFAIVADEIKTAWVARMKTLLEQLEGRTILFWMAAQVPPDRGAEMSHAGPDPLFIDQAMLDELSPLATRVVECVTTPFAGPEAMEGMIVGGDDTAAAERVPGPRAHTVAADVLEPVLRDML